MNRTELNWIELRNVGAVGYDGGAVEDALPAEQVLRGAGARSQRSNRKDAARGVQSGAGRAQGGRGAAFLPIWRGFWVDLGRFSAKFHVNRSILNHFNHIERFRPICLVNLG